MPALVTAAALAGFPGAPFSETVVDAAGESVRADAGWHIAPVITETVVVDGSGQSPLLILPTLKIVSVSQVRVIDADGLWAAHTAWRVAGSGMLYNATGWPYGIAGVEVTMRHGYSSAPPDLLPVIAARCQRAMVDATVTQRSETVGARTSSEAYNINRLQLEAGGGNLSKYKLSRVA